MAWNFPGKKKKELPDGLWIKCDGCQAMVFRKEVEAGLKVCPECKYHFRISARERLGLILDEGSFEEYDADLVTTDPLGFADRMPYSQRLEEARKQTGMMDAILTGRGKIAGQEVVIGAMDPHFVIGSMGAVVGERVVRATERAAETGTPLILFCAGGGARMMEGMISLSQMARTAAAVGRLRDANSFYISVLTNPTFAGTLASFAFLGDVVVAEPKAMIGFTGATVIRETLHIELPKGFQTAEFLQLHGFVDRIVGRAELKSFLERLLKYAQNGMRAS